MITRQLLCTLQPKLDPNDAETVARHLQAAATRFEINSRSRVAHFLAQLAHESGFRPVEENLNYSAEGLRRTWPTIFTEQLALESMRNPERIANTAYQSTRLGPRLGNTEPGDGFRFRGRGFIQITGRSNYKKYGELIGHNIVDNPDLALLVDVSSLVAAAFWHENGLNRLADRAGFEAVEAITKKINGGKHGLEERWRHFQLAAKALT
ncbi:glycoside hydrolase family 19 protein [Corallococcus llansteffanensis]|uniref:Glycoside hydrolase family 19 protein n=1 Tax=Corallococcus llansteffanensis TaxID=2316731 RepID=A0A3A8QKE1_9BACT|nr:glycoside hydrolase family 19 protein [Corallococcus llansteffanensis]RKH68288.1 glycoside hydrolase family 19 protein [Corallococcus llansteffanensis]